MNWQNLRRGAFFAAVFVETLYVLFYFFIIYKGPDHAEHLHASWLVWQGQIPYKDFFEHHHPLLWYIAAPMVALFYKNVMIFYVARLVSAVVYIIMFWGVYRISYDFLKISKKAFITALMLFLLYPSFVISLFEFAPDSFMFASFVWGLWFYFRFLENKQQKMLNVSFILWTIAFLFLQKVLLMLFIPCVYTFYLVIRKETSLKTVIKATIIPLVLFGLFLSYFIYHQALREFIILNYDLNYWMCQLKGEGGFPKFTSIFMMTSLIAAFCLYDFLKIHNRYRSIFAVLLIGDFLFKMITWAPWIQYFMLIELGGLLIISQEIFTLKVKKASYILLSFIIYMHLVSIKVNPITYEKLFYFKFYLNLQNYIMINSQTKDDIIITDGDGRIFNIYGKNPHYYWFGFSNIAPLSYYLYGYGGAFDINSMVKYHKPVFLFKGKFINHLSFDANLCGEYHKYLEKLYYRFPNKGEGATAFADYWNQPFFYVIDDDIFDKYYKPTEKPYLFIRKDAPELRF